MIRCFRNLYRFGLDFSNLSGQITSQGQRNYTVPAIHPLPGYLAQRQSSKVVVMIHEWWGLNKSICETADIFSNLGNKFNVFVPDLYRSKPAEDAEDAGHKMSHLDWKKALWDIKEVREHFEKQGKSVYIMGFCMGGALTIATISSFTGFKAASPFYGIPDLKIFKVQNIKCPTLAHFGELDPLDFSCAKTARSFEQEAKKMKAPVSIKIWPGASHAFCNQNSKYFNSSVRDQAFKLTAQLFDKN